MEKKKSKKKSDKTQLAKQIADRLREGKKKKTKATVIKGEAGEPTVITISPEADVEEVLKRADKKIGKTLGRRSSKKGSQEDDQEDPIEKIGLEDLDEVDLEMIEKLEKKGVRVIYPNLKYMKSKYENVSDLMNYVESDGCGGGIKLVIMNFND